MFTGNTESTRSEGKGLTGARRPARSQLTGWDQDFAEANFKTMYVIYYPTPNGRFLHSPLNTIVIENE
jgi:hypothetical protein